MVSTELLSVQYGWIAVPRDLAKFTTNTSASNTRPAQASSIQIPTTKLASAAFESAKKLLPEPTVNHSLRVFLYGSIIMQQHFPELLASWPDFPETFYITCILHDVGTAPTLHTATKMSFEFRGGIFVWDLLKELKAEEGLVEGVTEAIIRHQDLGTTGEISALGAIVQVATLFDNAGECKNLVHPDTIKSVTEAYPRLKWTSCFASTVREEIGTKPWCHSTHIEHFAEKIEANKLMEPYEDGTE